MDFAVPAQLKVKQKETEKREKYIDLARELKENIEHASDRDICCNYRVRYSNQRIVTGTGGL